MMIITLLVGILLPTIGRIRQNAAVGVSMSYINSLDGACRGYFNDFQLYPYSEPVGVFATGGERLVQCLVGYMPEGNYDAGTGTFTGGDGCDGYGFRMALRGKVYGPYAGVEKLPMETFPGEPGPSFKDAFGNPIFYYRFDKRPSDTAPKYYSADNPSDPGNRSGPADADDYAKSGGAYYRKDFILITPGPNMVFDVFDAPADKPRSDDLTNFFVE